MVQPLRVWPSNSETHSPARAEVVARLFNAIPRMPQETRVRRLFMDPRPFLWEGAAASDPLMRPTRLGPAGPPGEIVAVSAARIVSLSEARPRGQWSVFGKDAGSGGCAGVHWASSYVGQAFQPDSSGTSGWKA